MIYKKVLPEYSYKLLEDITKTPYFDKFYLAGGTALALLIGHRESIDLDFFTKEDFEINLLQEFPRKNYITNILHRNSVEIISDNTKVSFLHWAFPLTQNFYIKDNLKLADPVDIGLFKLLALQGRHTKKDIIDLYFIDKEIIKIQDLFNLFEKNYKKESFNLYDSSKRIFNDEYINMSEMPKLFEEVEFDECFKIVKKEIVEALKKII